MSINKTLCKYFDDKNKGYVTIGDIGGRIAYIVMTLCAAIAVFISICIGVWLMIQEKILHVDTNSKFIVTFVGTLGLLFLAAILATAGLAIIHKVSNIKVVPCERVNDK